MRVRAFGRRTGRRTAHLPPLPSHVSRGQTGLVQFTSSSTRRAWWSADVGHPSRGSPHGSHDEFGSAVSVPVLPREGALRSRLGERQRSKASRALEVRQRSPALRREQRAQRRAVRDRPRELTRTDGVVASRHRRGNSSSGSSRDSCRTWRARRRPTTWPTSSSRSPRARPPGTRTSPTSALFRGGPRTGDTSPPIPRPAELRAAPEASRRGALRGRAVTATGGRRRASNLRPTGNMSGCPLRSKSWPSSSH
jgi:hypothetical protein